MAEIINTYLLENPAEMVQMDRKDFYDEQIRIFKETGKPTKAVEVINVLLFNSHGELTVQKRSFEKNHNPGLLDKSIGGHVENGNTPDYTVMVETIQELQTPSIVLRNQNDFDKTIKLLGKYLETVSVICHLKTEIKTFVKVVNGEDIEIANKMHLYIGVYDGRTRPVDRESKGVLFYSLPELENEMQKSPSTFTNDLHFIMKEYKKEIYEFLNEITK